MAEDIITLCAVGDVVVVRKNYELSFARVASILREADISFFNCETAYGERGSPCISPHGAGPHAPGPMAALTLAGFDVCTLANNHTLDWGVDACVECRQRLEDMGIAVCGAGSNISEARKPAILERKGIRVAFLGYCSVGPNWFLAEENKPGCAMVRAYTHYEPSDYQPGTPGPKVVTWPYKEDLQGMLEDIAKVSEQADIVIVAIHWGIHYVPAAIPDYEFEVGHAAIDAGADLVLGSHPHILKGIEIYRGKVIVHSLGNFVMEGRIADADEQRTMRLKGYHNSRVGVYGPLMFSPDTCKTLILKCVVSGREIRRVSYIPVMLYERWIDPEPLLCSDPRAQDIFQYMVDISRAAGLDTKYSWDGDEVVVIT